VAARHWQVRVPPQAPKGVVMLHALVLPVSAAVQSQAPEVGTHCLEAPMSPGSTTSLHSYCAGQPVVAQSAPQKLPPVGKLRQAALVMVEHSVDV
jgi:hypothetical protein